MYEEFFNLRRRPFAAAPAAETYIPTPAMEHARKGLIRTIERGDGPALVIGPAGSGKSLLGQILAHHFQSRFSVALLNSARLDSCRSLLQNILYELELPYRELEEGEMRLSLVDFLRRNDACPRGVLLIVDEAHLLPLRLLEEIRLITNIVDHGVSRVRLVLIGGPQLEERFTSPKLESFNQRVAARCYLQALNLEETTTYVQQMIIQAGRTAELFTADSIKAIYRASDGIPRLINQVGDQALMLTFLAGKKVVSVDAVEEAWADLQQLPTPWQNPRIDNEIAAASAAETVIEFGSLDDEDPIPAMSSSVMTSKGSSIILNSDPIDRSEDQLDILELGMEEYAAEPIMPPVTISRAPLTWSTNRDLSSDPGLFSAPLTISLSSFADKQDRNTEVELSFGSRRDIFGDDFFEEEHLVDHYAGLESALTSQGTAAIPIKVNERAFSPVASGEKQQGSSIAASAINLQAVCEAVQVVDRQLNMDVAIEFAPQVALSGGGVVNVVDTYSDLIPKSTHELNRKPAKLETFDPASDPVTPELVSVGKEQFEGRADGGDDRDILLIEGSHNTRPKISQRSRRGEYKQLFTSLRKV